MAMTRVVAAPEASKRMRVAVAATADVRDDAVLPARVDGMDLVVIGHGGGAVVYQGRCPHKGTLLAEGAIENGVLTCRGHGWRFDCGTGAAVDRPEACLKRFAAVVEDGAVMVDREEILAWQRRQAESQVAPPSPGPGLRALSALPGPKGLRWLGSALQLQWEPPRMHLVFERWCEEFGPLFSVRLMNRPALVVAEGELIDRILHERPATYRRVRAIEAVTLEMGALGVFSAEGEMWRRQRRPVAQALDAHRLRAFFPMLANVTRRLRRRWQQMAAQRRQVDVQQDLMRYTVDVTTALAFGYDMNTLEREGEVIQRHLKQILPMVNRRINAPFPYWHYLRLPADRSFDRAVEAIHQTIGEFIAAARQRLAQAPELAAHPANFLEAMLVAQATGQAPLDDDELFANIFTILLAGEDTTANTVAWMMHFMCSHPEVQRRMQEEVGAVLGQADVLQDVGDAARLVYVEAVAHESLRLKPVAPLFFLEPNDDVEIDGVRVPRGTLIVLLTRPNGLQERNFPEAREFRPERWLQGTGTAAQHRSGFVPFGSGPRLCPGRNLALLEAKAAIAMVCQNFDIRHAPGSGPVGEAFGFTMMPTDLRVMLWAR
jgi:cytochrome P450/nitrite reductase/ring-hydroxylating ferredoxin subunit